MMQAYEVTVLRLSSKAGPVVAPTTPPPTAPSGPASASPFVHPCSAAIAKAGHQGAKPEQTSWTGERAKAGRADARQAEAGGTHGKPQHLEGATAAAAASGVTGSGHTAICSHPLAAMQDEQQAEADGPVSLEQQGADSTGSGEADGAGQSQTPAVSRQRAQAEDWELVHWAFRSERGQPPAASTTPSTTPMLQDAALPHGGLKGRTGPSAASLESQLTLVKQQGCGSGSSDSPNMPAEGQALAKPDINMDHLYALYVQEEENLVHIQNEAAAFAADAEEPPVPRASEEQQQRPDRLVDPHWLQAEQPQHEATAGEEGGRREDGVSRACTKPSVKPPSPEQVPLPHRLVKEAGLQGYCQSHASDDGQSGAAGHDIPAEPAGSGSSRKDADGHEKNNTGTVAAASAAGAGAGAYSGLGSRGAAVATASGLVRAAWEAGRDEAGVPCSPGSLAGSGGAATAPAHGASMPVPLDQCCSAEPMDWEPSYPSAHASAEEEVKAVCGPEVTGGQAEEETPLLGPSYGSSSGAPSSPSEYRPSSHTTSTAAAPVQEQQPGCRSWQRIHQHSSFGGGSGAHGSATEDRGKPRPAAHASGPLGRQAAAGVLPYQHGPPNSQAGRQGGSAMSPAAYAAVLHAQASPHVRPPQQAQQAAAGKQQQQRPPDITSNAAFPALGSPARQAAQGSSRDTSSRAGGAPPSTARPQPPPASPTPLTSGTSSGAGVGAGRAAMGPGGPHAF